MPSTQFTIYTSEDDSAPSLTRTTGSLISVLDAALVTGYGSKVAAGWTKEYSSSFSAVYRMGSGSLSYLKVEDDGFNNEPGEARISGFRTMTNFNNGKWPFIDEDPLSVAETKLIVRKSANILGNRRWVIAADNRTLYMFVKTLDFGNPTQDPYFCWGFGDYFSYCSSDSHHTFISGRNAKNSGTTTNEQAFTVTIAALTSQTRPYGKYISSNIDGSPSSKLIKIIPDSVLSSIVTTLVLNGGDAALIGGNILLSPLLLIEHESEVTAVPQKAVIRGHFRGIHAWLHPYELLADGQIYGSATNNKTVIGIKPLAYTDGADQFNSALLVETSNTVEYNS